MNMERMEQRLGELLALGTTVSSLLLGVGLVLWMTMGDQPLATYALNWGIVVLIGTPMGRVLASAVAFALQRDWQMVGMTALVLASLFMSLMFALRG